jgi:hypothetical protein
MDPQLAQLLLLHGQQRMMAPPAQQPGAPPVAYPPLGASLAGGNNGVVPTTSTTNDVGQVIDENGNPLPSYARGEPAFGNASVGGGGGGYSSGSPAGDTGTTEAGGGAAKPGFSKVADALRGVVAPPRPDVVKPASPHPPAIRPIQGGELINLMASLGIAPKDVPSLRTAIGR